MLIRYLLENDAINAYAYFKEQFMATKSKKNSNNYVIQRIKNLPWAVIGVVTVIVLLINLCISAVSSYNEMVVLRNTADAQWQQVEVQLQRRVDLIPNLVSTVEAAQIQEKDIVKQITDARTRYGTANSVNARAAAATDLDSAISRLLVISENYPQLASTQVVQNLQAELAGTENKLSAERLRFNDDVRAYNTYVQVFPKNIVANAFGFDQKVYFDAADNAAAVPKVNVKHE
jgi:LemA protein